MKRRNNLFAEIVSEENLQEAIVLACKPNGRTSPSKRNAIAKARANPKEAIEAIRALLLGEYKTSQYNIYPLFDPKLRYIYSLPFFPDRIAHHALIRVLEPFWDSRMMHASFACRKNKGQHQAGKWCGDLTRKYRYVAQFDVAQFYVSINHEILKKIVRHKIKDKPLLKILDEIIDSISTRDKNLEMLYKMRDSGCKNKDVEREIRKLEASKERDNGAPAGLPIGSYTSQWFGNLYLNELDTFLKQELRCKNVIRYCDDFLVFSDDKAFLHEVKAKVKEFMWGTLHLMLSKAEVFPTNQGVDFCGYRYFPQGYVLLRKRTAKRQKKQMRVIQKQYDSGAMSKETAVAKIASMDGWMRWAKCHHYKIATGFYDLKARIRDEAVQ